MSLRSRLLGHVRANAVAYLALFVALGGTGAYAANTIGSADIIDGSIKKVDIGTSQITSDRIYNGSVLNADIGTNAVTGDKVDENSLNLGAFFAANQGTGFCTADDHVAVTCASTTVKHSRAGRIQVTAAGTWHTAALDDEAGPGSDVDDPTVVRGRCSLTVDGAAAGSDQIVGERDPSGGVSTHPTGANGSISLVGLSDTRPAGTSQITVRCTEEDGDLDWDAFTVVAAVVDDSTAAATAG